MGVPKVIRVDFHNSLCTYFGGQTLTGAVHIANDEDINNMNGKIIFVTIICMSRLMKSVLIIISDKCHMLCELVVCILI